MMASATSDEAGAGAFTTLPVTVALVFTQYAAVKSSVVISMFCRQSNLHWFAAVLCEMWFARPDLSLMRATVWFIAVTAVVAVVFCHNVEMSVKSYHPPISPAANRSAGVMALLTVRTGVATSEVVMPSDKS